MVDKKCKLVGQEFFVDGLDYALRKIAGVPVVLPLNSTGFVKTGAQFSYPTSDFFWIPCLSSGQFEATFQPLTIYIAGSFGIANNLLYYPDLTNIQTATLLSRTPDLAAILVFVLDFDRMKIKAETAAIDASLS